MQVPFIAVYLEPNNTVNIKAYASETDWRRHRAQDGTPAAYLGVPQFISDHDL